MTTREDIDRALAEWDDPLAPPDAEEYFVSRRTMVATVQAARRGRLLFPSICQTCGGSGWLVWSQEGHVEFSEWSEKGGTGKPCPSCGGSGKEWPEWVVETVASEVEVGSLHAEPFTVTALRVLDALAALEVNE